MLEYYEKELATLADKLAVTISNVNVATKRLAQAQEINQSLKKTLDKKDKLIEQELKDQEILIRRLKKLEDGESSWFSKLKNFFS